MMLSRLVDNPLFLLFVTLNAAHRARTVTGGTTAEAERPFYDPKDGKRRRQQRQESSPPRFPDYHELLDWYYSEKAQGRQPQGDELRREIEATMAYRLSQPQLYYEGTGYIPGVDEGWRPAVDEGVYRRYRDERNDEVRRMKPAESDEKLPPQTENAHDS